ncbi:MAG: DUF1566 domain-containing protein [Bacteroidota bacterium]
MKNISFFLALFLLFSSTLFAQVGINSDNLPPDASAGLDVKFTDKGFLPPRVELVAINVTAPIISPAIGLLVYNTVNASNPPYNVVPGFYFWNGNMWIPIVATAGISGQTLRNEGGNWYSSSVLYNDGNNIGIGTVAPGQKLTVAGTIQTTSGGVMFPDGTTQTTAASGTVHTIGESYLGGIVFYVCSGGQHGLIAATVDQSTAIQWYNGSNTTTNAARDGLFAGMMNTERIICNQGPGNYAAQICANLKRFTFGDWYLPSKYELNLLYQEKEVVGGFPVGINAFYWSSSEDNNTFAWSQNFYDGTQYFSYKNLTYYVRAIRAF